MSRTFLLRVAAAACLLAWASGCTPVGALAAAGATAGVAVAEERSTRDALDDLATGVAVNNQLLNRSAELFRDVDVEVNEGRVLLTGSVPRQEDRVEAAEAAWRAAGTREVINELTVAEDAGPRRYAEDVWITTQLRARLLRDVGVDAVNYNIETVEGVVHLIGLANTAEELSRVTRHAASTPGVRQVVSHVLFIDDPRRKTG